MNKIFFVFFCFFALCVYMCVCVCVYGKEKVQEVRGGKGVMCVLWVMWKN